MYPWITHTFNTIKGICPHGCTYCYMRRFPQKPVRFDSKELNTDLGSENFIFVGSSCDMFADAIPDKWIMDTLSYCESFTGNKYLFQSKNPTRIAEHRLFLPDNSVICTTIETNRYYEQMADAPHPKIRASAMELLFSFPREFDKYVTIEPIMELDLPEMVELIKMCNPKQVNIGADSGNNHLPEPSKDKLLALIEELQKFTVIAQKRNVGRLLK